METPVWSAKIARPPSCKVPPRSYRPDRSSRSTRTGVQRVAEGAETEDRVRQPSTATRRGDGITPLDPGRAEAASLRLSSPPAIREEPLHREEAHLVQVVARDREEERDTVPRREDGKLHREVRPGDPRERRDRDARRSHEHGDWLLGHIEPVRVTPEEAEHRPPEHPLDDPSRRPPRLPHEPPVHHRERRVAGRIDHTVDPLVQPVAPGEDPDHRGEPDGEGALPTSRSLPGSCRSKREGGQQSADSERVHSARREDVRRELVARLDASDAREQSQRRSRRRTHERARAARWRTRRAARRRRTAPRSPATRSGSSTAASPTCPPARSGCSRGTTSTRPACRPRRHRRRVRAQGPPSRPGRGSRNRGGRCGGNGARRRCERNGRSASHRAGSP